MNSSENEGRQCYQTMIDKDEDANGVHWSAAVNHIARCEITLKKKVKIIWEYHIQKW